MLLSYCHSSNTKEGTGVYRPMFGMCRLVFPKSGGVEWADGNARAGRALVSGVAIWSVLLLKEENLYSIGAFHSDKNGFLSTLSYTAMFLAF